MKALNHFGSDLASTLPFITTKQASLQHGLASISRKPFTVRGDGLERIIEASLNYDNESEERKRKQSH
jgi:hypothetical protein